jgi:Icc-related predicted phosphoesterase
MKILYTSDIHASSEHLEATLTIAEREAVEAVVIGGDIVPHYLPDADTLGLLQAQALYLKNVLVPTVREFKARRPVAVYIDLANDDFICNRKILEDHNLELFNLLHLQKHSLNEDVDIIGYMIVPPTPFYRKDWEKPDSAEMTYAVGNVVTLDGLTSAGGTLEETFIDPGSKDTIENDLAQLSKSIDRPFVFVAHSPPYQTPLDVLDNGLHVGSISIRRFIEDWSRKGLLVAALHGHIHSAPYRSGAIHTTIENAICINPGQNEGPGAHLRYVILELTARSDPPRIQILYQPDQ